MTEATELETRDRLVFDVILIDAVHFMVLLAGLFLNPFHIRTTIMYLYRAAVIQDYHRSKVPSLMERLSPMFLLVKSILVCN